MAFAQAAVALSSFGEEHHRIARNPPLREIGARSEFVRLRCVWSAVGTGDHRGCEPSSVLYLRGCRGTGFHTRRSRRNSPREGTQRPSASTIGAKRVGRHGLKALAGRSLSWMRCRAVPDPRILGLGVANRAEGSRIVTSACPRPGWRNRTASTTSSVASSARGSAPEPAVSGFQRNLPGVAEDGSARICLMTSLGCRSANWIRIEVPPGVAHREEPSRFQREAGSLAFFGLRPDARTSAPVSTCLLHSRRAAWRCPSRAQRECRPAERRRDALQQEINVRSLNASRHRFQAGKFRTSCAPCRVPTKVSPRGPPRGRHTAKRFRERPKVQRRGRR